jgi:hypothetical protein
VSGETGAGDKRLSQDVAELLASMTALVGAERAVASARVALGDDALATLPAFLERAWRGGESREVRRARPQLLPRLRASVVEPPARPASAPAES